MAMMFEKRVVRAKVFARVACAVNWEFQNQEFQNLQPAK